MFMNTFLVHVDGHFQARYIELWPSSPVTGDQNETTCGDCSGVCMLTAAENTQLSKSNGTTKSRT